MLEGGTDTLGVYDGEVEGELVNELVLVRKRLDSELQGLAEGLPESDKDE